MLELFIVAVLLICAVYGLYRVGAAETGETIDEDPLTGEYIE